jgi:small subunit ribosomal protein S4e
MGKKGGLRHTKRKSAPSFWPIHRKEKVWISKPRPGPHSGEKSIPLLIILRDMLGLASKGKEAGVILADGKVKVNGVVRCDEKFSVGLMDIVEIAGVNQAYRVVLSTHRLLHLHPIDGEEKAFRLARIEDKFIIRGGNIQVSIHDGGSLLVKHEVVSPAGGIAYKAYDTLKLSISDGQILDHIRFVDGAYAMIIGGKNIGRSGNIAGVEKISPAVQPIVKIKSPSGDEYNSIINYIFVIGREKPEISLPGGGLV